MISEKAWTTSQIPVSEIHERKTIHKQRNPTEGQVIPAVSEILTSAKTFITDLIQQLNSGIALNSQYFYYWNVEHCGGKPDKANYKWGFLYLCHIQSNLYAWSFTPNMYLLQTIFLLQLFARLEGPSHYLRHTNICGKRSTNSLYYIHFHEMDSNTCYVKLHLIQPHVDI